MCFKGQEMWNLCLSLVSQTDPLQVWKNKDRSGKFVHIPGMNYCMASIMTVIVIIRHGSNKTEKAQIE